MTLRPTVSPHAIVRYQERVAGVTSAQAEQAITVAVQRGVDVAGWHLAQWHVRIAGLTFVLAGAHVLTVLHEERRRTTRMNARCRHRIAFDERRSA